MSLTVLGINHNSAAVEVRERVAFAPEQLVEAHQHACAQVGLGELLILSTCNRTELCFTNAAADADAGPRALQWLAEYHHLQPEQIADNCYQHNDSLAIQHLMQVASGLDSMVLGEPQILGQMKSAYAVADEAGTIGVELGRIIPTVFSVAKKVRTDTAIGENPVSVAYAAVNLAGRIFADLKETKALLVGAGETIELVARHLSDAGVGKIVVANRTLGRARELAQKFGVEAILLADIPVQLETSDIVITSTASQLPILGKGAVEQAMKVRKHRPILMVDIAVPRDIESQVGELDDIYLYSVDDLREIVDQNLAARRDEARRADELIAAGVVEFEKELRSRGAVDTVRALRSQAEAMRDAEVERALQDLARGGSAEQVVAQLARSLTNKLIHAPTIELKRASAEGHEDVLLAGRRLLGIDDHQQD
ncbi:glutamyl-tRNA reductase [Halieaceae bacterium IMCC14734]|uniref:Glutamyl-tRNA reductase n=1 Tax=Candidatus Litorirhabdus singularis TaxID=2518993 RepID=A0ABT3TJI7_9GAMM|nr:glutamyl-tRNA reductase [Candidatus Litorirhabdus singularis]MCX2982482.1 glutamyl-tRNA reductase [Candidatus Litorirhabdus singularis]